MASQRFFIALVPPPEIQAEVNDIKHHFQEYYGSRKALNSPTHITLQAPFEWSNEQNLDELTAELRKFAENRERFAISLSNFGAFPPKVVYIYVVQNSALIDLQQNLSAFMESTYGLIDRHYATFCPHMTVAFRDLTKTSFNQAWPEFRQKPIELSFMTETLTLTAS